jgi:hypothetical protein
MVADAAAVRSLFEEVEGRLAPGRAWAEAAARLEELWCTGLAPNPVPDGFMRGRALLLSWSEPVDALARRVAGPHRRWEGKRFERGAARGVNVLRRPGGGPTDTVERFPFAMRVAPAATDPSRDVLAIDYDVPENPRWVRPVLDEAVEAAPGCFVGRIHLRWGASAHPVGFFALEA